MSERITIILAAPPETMAPLVQAFGADARYNLMATATSAADLQLKLSLQPQALLAWGKLFAGPDELATLLGPYEGQLYLVLPADSPDSLVQSLREMPSVRAVLSGEPDLPELAGRIQAGVHAERLVAASDAPTSLFQHGGRAAMVGWRCIAVWSLQGGVGRSTVATALALEAAERRLPTLLLGLGAPDVIPLRLHFEGAEPHLGQWAAEPGVDSLRRHVRRFDVLDVLAGFPDPGALDNYASLALQPQQGLPALSNTAARAGYAVVVLDVSSSEMAAAAIAAANTLVLVATPTPEGILAVGKAVHLVAEAMSRRHAIPVDGMHLLLNRVRDSLLSPAEFVQALGRLPVQCPPLAAVIPDDPRIDEARLQYRPAYHVSEPLRRAMKHVGDRLFAPPPSLMSDNHRQAGRAAKVWRLGPLRIKR